MTLELGDFFPVAIKRSKSKPHLHLTESGPTWTAVFTASSTLQCDCSLVSGSQGAHTWRWAAEALFGLHLDTT